MLDMYKIDNTVCFDPLAISQDISKSKSVIGEYISWSLFEWSHCAHIPIFRQTQAKKNMKGIYLALGVYLNPFIKSDTSDRVCLINFKFLYSKSWLNHFNFIIKHLSLSVWGLRKK